MKSSKKGEKDIVLKYVLKNAFDFQGRANPQVVLGMILKENPELKKDVPSVLSKISEAIKKVEKLSLEKIRGQLQETAPELLEKKEEKREGPLKPLLNAKKGEVVVRIAPSPSGPLHIGHAYGVSLNYEYAKMYGGKLILRIEDTNPENIYEPAYELIERDAQWLTENGVSQVIVQSSRLGIYYDYAEKLVEMEKAYVCTCEAEEWRKLKNDGQACPCRSLEKKENLLRYARMFNEYAEGEAVLRLKTDISHKNPAMRDFAILRINEHVHPKTGKEQRVWPLMLYSVAIDDHELGVTHVLNGKDHADNATKERMILDYFGWKHPEYQHWGRINFEGFELSTSKTRLAIEQNQYQGWEDLRLPFLPALRKRGYQPGAFRKYALEIGLSLNDKTVSREEFWKSIDAFNREIVEPLADRYFFIDDPKEIKISGAPQKKAELDLHPDYPARGKRLLQAKGNFLISGSDLAKLAEGKLHRLMDYGNFEVVKGKFNFVSEDYEKFKNSSKKGIILHWLPTEPELPDVEVQFDNGSVVSGKGEDGLKKIKLGAIVQLERRYFAALISKGDKEKKKIVLAYLHR